VLGAAKGLAGAAGAASAVDPAVSAKVAAVLRQSEWKRFIWIFPWDFFAMKNGRLAGCYTPATEFSASAIKPL
jgi:hypothetical protein